MHIARIFIRVADPARHSDPALKSFVTMVIAGDGLLLTIEDIRIIRTEAGRLIVAWPNRKIRGVPDDRSIPVYLDDDRQPYWHRDTIHPTDDATRVHFAEALIRAYWEAIRARQMNYEKNLSDATPRPAALAG